MKQRESRLKVVEILHQKCDSYQTLPAWSPATLALLTEMYSETKLNLVSCRFIVLLA